MENKKRTVLKGVLIDGKVLIFAFLLILFLIPFFLVGYRTLNFLCLLTFAINGLVFVAGSYRASCSHSLSMNLIYWLFMFFFMYFAPIIQYQLNVYPWSTTVTESETIFVNLIVLLFNVFFLLGCFIAKRTKIVGLPDVDTTKWLCASWEFNKRSKIVLTFIVFLLAAYSLSKTGFVGIFSSRAQAMQVFYSGQNSAVELIVESVIPAFMSYVVAEAAQCTVEKKENGTRFVLLFACLLICFFPTTIPRYKAATIYGVVAIVLFPWIIRKTRFFWLFTIGLFLIFPLLGALRNTISHASIQSWMNEGFFESYTDGNYDTWRMVVSAFRYTVEHGSTWGYQLLGSLLFFVPSAIWSNKPIGSGAMLIKSELGSDVFSNVSCPIIAEGLVNFGIFGVVLFALILGILVTKLDKKYWDNFTQKNTTGMFAPYLFLIFMLFFVLRGDLLSGFAYTCGFIAIGLILKLFAQKS